MQDLLVSVVVPVFNCERYLAEAIESVLAQSYADTEVIVVDDGSTDNSKAVAKGFGKRVNYLFQENAGASAARNRGAELAKGELLSFLDADDIWTEDKLSLQAALLNEREDVDMVFGHVEQFISPELESDEKKRLICPLGTMPAYLPGAMLVRRDAFWRVGPFATDVKVAEFLDWYARARERGLNPAMLPGVVYKRRLHNENLGVRESGSRIEYTRVLRRSLERRRLKAPDDPSK